MADVIRVELPWVALDEDQHPAWRASFCLYAYLHPERDWLLYIGKADYQTVRQRLHGDHKAALFEFFDRRYGIDQVRVFQSDILRDDGRRRTSQLLSLTETLLIMRLQPPGNSANTRSRAYRPGLQVYCRGDWPFKKTGFHDWN